MSGMFPARTLRGLSAWQQGSRPKGRDAVTHRVPIRTQEKSGGEIRG